MNNAGMGLSIFYKDKLSPFRPGFIESICCLSKTPLTGYPKNQGIAMLAYSSPNDQIASRTDLINIENFDLVQIDLRYATLNNFTEKNIYGDFRSAWLHEIAAEKFRKAVEILQFQKPQWGFLVFDALRPRSAQWQLWNYLEGSDKQSYVADPRRGSLHNYGFAIDLTLLNDQGKEIDMGTGFDDFSDLAQPRREEEMIALGQLSNQQKQNRMLLRQVMEDAGFDQLEFEWWHFDAGKGAEIREKHIIVE
jgi:D-alanyl-D-alanine dipeptidase